MRKMRLCKPFTCHTSEPPDSLSTFRRATFQPFLDLSPFFSNSCELFCVFQGQPFCFQAIPNSLPQNTPPGVPTTFQRSNIQTFRHSSAPHPSHCSRTLEVPQ